jgi:hypothetical protein
MTGGEHHHGLGERTRGGGRRGHDGDGRAKQDEGRSGGDGRDEEEQEAGGVNLAGDGARRGHLVTTGAGIAQQGRGGEGHNIHRRDQLAWASGAGSMRGSGSKIEGVVVGSGGG